MVGGYEPKSADAFYKRTAREYARFGKSRNIEADIDPLRLSDDGLIATLSMRTTGNNWMVKTGFNFFVWNSIVLSDFARPLPVRIWRYLVTFFDYVFSGTAFSFARIAWRFALYFLYPATMLAIFSTIAIFIAAQTRFFDHPVNLIASAAFGILMFLLLLKMIGERWFVLHLMDLWSFSRYYLHGLRPDAGKLIERYARAVVECSQSEEYDEILLIGHSTGGALILDIAATALKLDPQLATRKCPITILTVGSTALKIGLHPKAEMFRQNIQTLVDTPTVNWIEYQSHTDIINFDKSSPVEEMQLENNRDEAFPLVRRVRIRETLDKDTYARIKRNFFRVHYQFIMANTRPYHYDFFMICCGPTTLTERAQNMITGAWPTEGDDQL